MSKRIKVKAEGGQGGKLGHSNMAYWGENDEAKDDGRVHRRLEIPKVIERDIKEWGDDAEDEAG